MRHDSRPGPNLHRTFDNHVGADFNAGIDLSFGIDYGGRMNAHQDRFFLLRVIVIPLVLGAGFAFWGGNPISLFDPRSKIDEPTTLGAKGSIRVILPTYFVTTGRTLDRFGHSYLLQESRVLEAN